MRFPYRADHVGSLLRPRNLLEARANLHVTSGQLKQIENQEIIRILARQKELGFKIFTDGEFRRRGFMTDFYDSVDGLDYGDQVDRTWQAAAGSQTAQMNLRGIVVEKIRQRRRLTKHELEFLKIHSPGDIKMTLPSANQFPAIAYKNGVSERAYKSRSEFLWDVVPIIRSEIQALAAEGVNYIQIDAPRYSYYIDPKWRAYVKEEMGHDPEEALEEAIRADNACLEAAGHNRIIRAIHLCRGNNRSQWYAQGGYDPIAERLFSQLNVDAFLLEYDSERAGTFEPLRFVPSKKAVVLGLISSKLPALESRDQLVRRIEQASRYVSIENLAVSPQCGFASTMEGNLMSEDEQWRKLELVVETARYVWKDA